MIGEIITVTPDDKTYKIHLKEMSGTCQVDVKNVGTFLANMEKFSSNGNIKVRILERLEAK